MKSDIQPCQLRAVFEKQKCASVEQGAPSYQQRCDDLFQLKRMVVEHQKSIVQAISEDYTNRAMQQTLLAEILPVLDDIDYNRRHLKKWMKTQKRKIDSLMYPWAKNRVQPQPLGVLGLIVPWNFPINLSFSQIAAGFSAGNRIMVKMSENSRALTKLLQSVSGDYFPQDKLCFFEETGSTGIAFSKIPFDLLVFTGSGATGRKVMRAAADNLTPVVLELGGKAPAVIDAQYPLKKAVQRILFSKHFNGGQICTSVDYVFVHAEQEHAFIRLAQQVAKKMCPDIEHADYTSIINDQAFQRLQQTLADAEQKGAVIHYLSEQRPNPKTRKFPMAVVSNVTSDMIIARRETFGPILMLKTYRDTQEVIDYINAQDRPLAFYPFSYNNSLVENYIAQVMSGGVTVNDVLLHVAQHDMPFGGVGASGMGHYHGYEGFLTMSKLRPIFYQTRWSALSLLAPPYKKLANTVLNVLIKRKS